MDFNQIMQLTEWLEKSAFTQYNLSVGGVQIGMNKCGTAPVVAAAPAALPVVAPPPMAAPVAAVAPKVETEGHLVRSPIVGTYYESSSPDKPAFVKVGDAVKKGDVLCILEAMKIMNEICADTNGIIVEAYGANGQMVEARAPLFKIEV